MKIKRILLLILAVLLVVVGCNSGKNSSKDEIRATWISYIDYTQILWGKSEQEYRNNVDQMIKNLHDLKLNTIYVHASAFTDAYYPSNYYPTAQYVTGKIGDTLSFDPFGILVKKAKEAGFRVEAWINPLRSFTQEQMKEAPTDCIQRQWIKEGKRSIVFYHDRYYLNPAYEEVHQLIVGVVSELVKNYDIDAIHMDDYFYPDQVQDSFDAEEYSQLGQGKTLAEFRKNNVNVLIKSISSAIKKIDKNCDFTISPAGNIQYSTESIYGDVGKWIKEEWIDMVIPQIYFGYQHETLPYDACLKQWEDLVKGTDVALIPGLAAYKINTIDNYAKSGKEEWLYENDLLARQIKEARNASNYRGFSLFSYYSMMYPDAEDSALVWQQIDHVLEILKD